jgi:hypothetical protein
LLFSGCVSSGTPTMDMMFHGELSWAKSSTQKVQGVEKEKLLYIIDYTRAGKSKNDYKEYHKFENKKYCIPGPIVKDTLKKDGFTLTQNKLEADYILTIENIGCGIHGKILPYLRNPVRNSNKIKIDNFDKRANNASNFASGAANMSSMGHSNAAGAMAGLAVLSLFSGDPNKRFSSFVDAELLDIKTNKKTSTVFYINGTDKACFFNECAKYANEQIAKRISIDLGTYGLFGSIGNGIKKIAN